jgi:NAD(P)-dependent dehydrogenase (short-subunit alcohol dehydrogenase family)
MQSSRQQWLTMFDVNIVSMAILIQKALPYLRESKGASIVNIGSCTASVGIVGLNVYPTTKAAIHEMTRCMAIKLAPFKIRANVVAPGATMSDPIVMMTGGRREIADVAIAAVQPLGRLVNADEVAQAVLFLASDLSSFTTGAVFAIDGGYSAMGPEATVSVAHRIMAAIATQKS